MLPQIDPPRTHTLIYTHARTHTIAQNNKEKKEGTFFSHPDAPNCSYTPANIWANLREAREALGSPYYFWLPSKYTF